MTRESKSSTCAYHLCAQRSLFAAKIAVEFAMRAAKTGPRNPESAARASARTWKCFSCLRQRGRALRRAAAAVPRKRLAGWGRGDAGGADREKSRRAPGRLRCRAEGNGIWATAAAREAAGGGVERG